MKLIYHSNIGKDGNLPPRRQRAKMARSFTIVVDNIPTQEEALKGLLPVLIGGKGRVAIDMPIGAVVVNPAEQFARKEGVLRAEAAKTNTIVNVVGTVFLPDGSMQLHLNLREIPFFFNILPGGRPLLDEQNADALLYAIRGDWLEESRKKLAPLPDIDIDPATLPPENAE